MWLAVLGAPLAAGGVAPPVFLALAAAGAAALACAAYAVRREVAIPAAGWALAGGTLLAVLSSVPLPTRLTGLLSPRALALASLPPDAAPAHVPWSLDPPASLLDAARLAGLAALAAVAAWLSRRAGARRRLAAAVALSGASLAAIAAVHELAGGGEFLARHLVHEGSPLASPFVNSNHAASLAGLSAATALGLAATSRGAALVAWAACAFGSASVVPVSRSVGGLAGLAFAAATFALLALQRSASGQHAGPPARGGAWRVAALALVPLSAAVLMDLDEVAVQMQDLEGHLAGKMRPWRQAMQLALAHPLTGVGRAAFGPAFEAFAPPRTVAAITHPENFVLHWWAEWGLAAAAGGAAALLWTLRAGARRRDAPESAPLFAGLLAGCVSVLVHDLADFSLEFAGVGVPFAVALGVLGGGLRGPVPLGRRGLVAAALATGLVGAAAARWGAPHLVDAELAALKAREAAMSVRELDEAYRDLRRRHPADPLVVLRAADALLARSSDPGARPADRADAVARSMHHLAHAQELSRGGAAHVLTARAFARMGRRAQALTELRLAFASGALQTGLEEALRLGATPAEIADLVRTATQAAADEGDRRPEFEGGRVAVEIVRLLWHTRKTPSLARQVADEMRRADPRLDDDPEVLAIACAVATVDGQCAARAARDGGGASAPGCSAPGEVEAVARGTLSTARRLRELRPLDEAGHLCAFDALVLEGDEAGAERTLREGLDRTGGPAVRLALAEWELNHRRPSEALATAESLTEGPDTGRAQRLRLLRVWAYAAAGRPQRALAEAEQNAKNHPDDVWSHRQLSEALERTGQVARAAVEAGAAERLASGGHREHLRAWREQLEARARALVVPGGPP